MFSTGQLYFAVSFLVVFIISMIIVYRKDRKLHRKYYKGSYIVLIGFLAFVGFLFFIKYFIKD